MFGLLIVVALVILSGKPTLGAMSSWTQTDWSGGADGGVGAVHPDDQDDWTAYANLADVSVAVSPGDVKLSTQDLTVTDDGTLTTTGTATGGGFANGTATSTAISGSGADANVGLASTTTFANTFETDFPPIPGTIGVGSGMIRNGADDDIYVLQGNGTGFFRYSVAGNTWTTLTAVPGAVGDGAVMIRNGADDDIYVLQGNGTGFFRYSVAGNTWTTLTSVPLKTFFGGAMIRNGAEDDIYVFRGGGSTGFYRYSISGNSWTALTAVPAGVSNGRVMIRNDADDAIYVLRGSSSTDFYKYSISGNSWTTLTAVPGGAGTGSAMLRNGSDDTIYLLRGNSADFYRYSISGNTWTELTSMPGSVFGAGGAMLRNGADDDIYVLQGSANDGFVRYSISSNTWTTLANVPAGVNAGSAMLRNGADDGIYVLTSSTFSKGFFKYSILGNSWIGTSTSALAAVPGQIANGAAMLRNGASDDVYVLQGGSSSGLHKYSISSNTWTTLANVPGTVTSGGGMIRNGGDDHFYVLRGGMSVSFYRYSISSNTWTTLANVPAGIENGAAMLRSGSDDDIYLLQGNTSNSFYRYSISSNTWTALTAVPSSVSYGSSMLRSGSDDHIYVLPGNATTGFYRYSISTNAWTTLTVVPSTVGAGSTAIRNGADDDIYLLPGSNSTGFYKYSISGNTWTTLAAVPATVHYGSAMIRNGADNDIYTLRGNSAGFFRYSISADAWTTLPVLPSGSGWIGSALLRNDADQQIYILQSGSTNLWRYTINDVTYPASGIFTSAVIDTKGVTSFGDLSWSSTLPTNTTLTFATRSGATAVPDDTWSAWSAELSNSAGSAVVSPVARYFQYRGTFGTSNTASTPTLSDITLAYAAYRSSGTLTSSSFDAVETANVIDGLSWTEDATSPAGTSVTVSLRTASASGGLTGTWTDFTHDTPDCTKTGGAVECSASAMPSAFTSGDNDRYLQYKVALTTADLGVTPTVASVGVDYGLIETTGRGEGTITVVKTVVNDNSGTKTFDDFPLFVDGAPVASGETNTFPAPADAYTVTETSDPEYARTFSGDCDVAGRLTLVPGEQKVCIVTNDDIGSVETVPPIIDIVKVPSPLSLPDGPGPVSYTYTLRNIGMVPVTDVTLVGDTCAPVVLVSGDTDLDGQLDVDETWTYTCSTTLTETHTNTVLATGWANGISATDLASATVIVGAPVVPPLIHVTKVPSPLTLPAGGGLVTYTETITNPGTEPLTNVRLTDDKCAPVVRISGDVNGDGKLDPSETWTYTCQSHLDRTTVNTAVATGEANGLIARDFAIVTVVVAGLPTPYSVDEALASAPNISVDKGLIAASAAAPCAAGSLLKAANDQNASTQADSAVYYCGVDGKRYVFPDSDTYFSWYPDFSGVRIVSAATLSAIPLAGEVTYRPGSRMLKIMSDSRVYAVSQGGVLRWVTQEAVARALYGPDWNQMISDIPAPRFSASYRLGEPITLREATPACATDEHFTDDLSSGSSNIEVRPLQELLQCLGHFPPDVDTTGYFGPITRSSVERFQSSNGISPTGTVGPMTREALNRYEAE